MESLLECPKASLISLLIETQKDLLIEKERMVVELNRDLECENRLLNRCRSTVKANEKRIDELRMDFIQHLNFNQTGDHNDKVFDKNELRNDNQIGDNDGMLVQNTYDNRASSEIDDQSSEMHTFNQTNSDLLGSSDHMFQHSTNDANQLSYGHKVYDKDRRFNSSGKFHDRKGNQASNFW